MTDDATFAYWQQLTRDQLTTWASPSTVCILPVSATEQHGPHMPLGTDALINAGVLHAALARVKAPTKAIVLPALEIGDSLEHLSSPGTISAPLTALLDLWLDCGRAVARAGMRRLVIFNTHGGQKPHVDLAAVRLRAELGMLVVRANSGALGKPDHVFTDTERRFGLHGGDIETSLLLHLHPELVDRPKAQNFKSAGQAIADEGGPLGVEQPVGIAWLAEDLHPEGVCGDAGAASAAKGELLLNHIADRLARLIEQTARLTWPPANPNDPADGQR